MKKAFDQAVLKEMILYISARCQDRPAFGSIHLNKMLHYADFFWYAQTGESMSGEAYLRQKHGQVPKHLLQARNELVNEGKLAIEDRQYFGKIQKRPIALPPFNYQKLTDEQKQFLDEIITALADYSATEVSEQIAHEDLARQYLKNDEAIPYETVFFRRKNAVSEETMVWAQSAIGEYEEALARTGG